MSEERKVRISKAAKLRELGLNPYADGCLTTHTLAEAAVCEDGTPVKIAGRLVARRNFGKLVFAHLLDYTGKLQLSFEKQTLPEKEFALATTLLDVGDFIAVSGNLWTTRTGERTVRAQTFSFLSKAVRPLPEKWHGLQNKEACYRQRYLDLVANPGTRERFVLRSQIISFIRRYLEDRQFLEVETPILQAASSARLPGRLSRTTTRSTAISFCGSHQRLTSNG